MNTTGQASTAKPVPPAVLACFPFGRDGTLDVGPPALFVIAGATKISWFTAGVVGLTPIVGAEQAALLSAFLDVQIVVRGEDEAELDSDTALMHNIRSVHTVEIEVTHSDDGVANLQTSVSSFT